MSNSMAGRGDVDIDLPRLGLAIWERRNWLVGLTAGAGLLAFLLSSSIAPLYRAESRILIEDRPAVGETASASTTGVLDAEAIASQVEVIRSNDLIARVVADLDLGSRSEFDPASSPSMLGDLLVLVGLADNPLEESSTTRVVAAVREKLQVYQVQNSRVIAIEFSSEDAQLSADVANAFAETYLAVQSGAKLESSTGAASLLEPEIAALAERVRAAEERVAAFRAENGLFMVGDNNSLAQRQLGDVSAELARVRGERANAQARARNARSAIEAGRSVDTIGGALDSTLIQRLREREIAVQSEIADLSTTLLDNHPRIRGLRSQLADLDAQIRAEIAKAVESLEGDAAVAALREEELVAQMNTIKASSAEAGSEEVQLRALEREAAAERQLLETYLNSARRASSLTAVGALPADARVITRATVPVEPYFPKTMVIVTVAMVATALLFSIVVLLAELMSGRGLKPVGNTTIEPSTRTTSTTFRVEGARFAEDMPYRMSTPMVSPIVASGIPAAGVATATATSSMRGSPRRPQIDAAVLADLDRTARDIENSRQPVRDVAKAPLARSAEPITAVALPEPLLASPSPVAEEDDVTLPVVAETLMARRVSVVACLSPEGDAGSLGSVQLTRFLAACGLQSLLVDMTASAAPTIVMTGVASEPGITDLLSGGVSIADSIHADLYSSADLIPVGGADPQAAMRAVARLPMIVEALGNAYDMVVIECGAIDVAALRRLTGTLEVATVLSIVEPQSHVVEPAFAALLDDGRHDTLVMMVEDGDGADHRTVSAA